MPTQGEGERTVRDAFKELVFLLLDKLYCHWYLRAFIQAFPIVWGFFIQAFKGHLYTEDGNLKTIPLVIAIVSALVSIFLVFYTAQRNKRPNQKRATLRKT